jgi:drug/metabolite transporter (DMT)-like permease
MAALRLTAASQLAGLAVMAPWLVLSGPELTLQDALYGTLAGVSSGASLALLYDACCRMSPALASAISAVVAALLAPVHAAITGNVPPVLAVVSMFSCVLGVGLVAAAQPRREGRRTTAPVLEAVLSGVFMSIYYISLALVSSAAFAVTEARVVATVMLALLLFVVAYSRAQRLDAETMAVSRRATPRALIFSVGLSGAIGTIAYGYAATTTASTLISIVAIVSMSPVVTAVLGYWWRREQFSALQIGGLSVCVIGATLAAVSTL